MMIQDRRETTREINEEGLMLVGLVRELSKFKKADFYIAKFKQDPKTWLDFAIIRGDLQIGIHFCNPEEEGRFTVNFEIDTITGEILTKKTEYHDPNERGFVNDEDFQIAQDLMRESGRKVMELMRRVIEGAGGIREDEMPIAKKIQMLLTAPTRDSIEDVPPPEFVGLDIEDINIRYLISVISRSDIEMEANFYDDMPETFDVRTGKQLTS